MVHRWVNVAVAIRKTTVPFSLNFQTIFDVTLLFYNEYEF
jgi:hypothetical protein